jgi:hypothetical protein
MQSRSSSSQFLLYIGFLAMAFAVIALGLMTAVKASAGLSQGASRDKTLLELQVENSRNIRQALAAPIVIPPLPAITARPARAVAAVTAQRRPARAIPQEALDAMAMSRSASADQSASEPQRAARYPTFDRFSAPF